MGLLTATKCQDLQQRLIDRNLSRFAGKLWPKATRRRIEMEAQRLHIRGSIVKPCQLANRREIDRINLDSLPQRFERTA